MSVLVAILGHREGLYLGQAINSAVLAKKHCENNGIDVRIIVVLDNADQLTTDVASMFSTQVTVVTSTFGDPGAARKSVLDLLHLTESYVAFLDGDDLFGEEWLTRAFQFASTNPGAVLHPEFNLFFGNDDVVVTRGQDSDSKTFDKKILIDNNPWSALAFVPCEILRACSYPTNDRLNRIAYEDWTWNIKTLKAGYHHRYVPGTIHFIRLGNLSSTNEKNKINQSRPDFDGFFLDTIMK